MEAQLISLDDYILFGGGANGESFTKRDDPSVMLKLYLPGKERQAKSELLLSHKAYDAGIPVPEPGEFVMTEDGRYGILFRMIEDKVSFARAVGNDPTKTEEYAECFARLCKELHSTSLDCEDIPNVKDKYLDILAESNSYTEEQINKITKFIKDAPESDTALHGDLQFGNAVMSADKIYFIDMGDFCYGHPYFDLGMVYLTCNLNGEDFNKEAFHMDNNTARRFWVAFAKEYFGDEPLEEIEAKILPYAALKTIIIERDAGRLFPEFRAVLEKTIF